MGNRVTRELNRVFRAPAPAPAVSALDAEVTDGRLGGGGAPSKGGRPRLVSAAGTAPDVSKASSKVKKPDAIDVHVGSRVRLRRTMLGMSQEKLGLALGITFQQIQKYEKGTNRIGSSRLQNIANVLSVPVSFFFEGQPESSSSVATAPEEDPVTAFLSTKESLDLNRAFVKIGDLKVRRKVVELVKALAAEADSE